MKLLALFPTHIDSAVIASFVSASLGEGWDVAASDDPDAVAERLADADIVLDALVPFTAQHVKAAERLRLIQAPSHGYDHIDIEAAAARGIPVANIGTSGAEAETVAEHAMLLLLASAKRLVEGHEGIRAGGWPGQALLAQGLTELRGRSLGIVGLGHIGREVAKRARAFGMAILYCDVIPATDLEAELGAERLELDELLRRSDAVTVHLPLSTATRGLIGRRELALLRDGGIFVNTSRGPVVDAAALADELAKGRIRAGIDVFEVEPPAQDDPLLRAPNLVMSPHVAGITNDSVRRLMFEALENLRRFASGEPLRDVVNGL